MGMIFRRLLHLLWSTRHDADLREEMETHRSLRQDQLERAGVAPGEASLSARRAFGNVTLAHETAREAWAFAALSGLLQDVGHALRSLSRRPLLACVAVLSLALAIGANVAIFSLIDRILLRPLDVPDAAALVTVEGVFESRGVATKRTSMNWHYATRVRDMDSFADAAIATTGRDRATENMVVTIGNAEPLRPIRGRFVTANYFRVFGVQPATGRDFGSADDSLAATPVIILSHAFWRRQFGGTAEVVGRTIGINGTAALVVGVAPARFTGTDLSESAPDVYLPMMAAARLATDVGMQTDGLNRFFSGRSSAPASPVSPLSMFVVVARAGLDARQAQAELAALEDSGQLPRYLVGTSKWHLRSLVETMVALEGGTDLRLFLGMLSGAVGLTLLIGCANLASLFLARTEERRAEMAIRAALGAGRRRLVQSAAAEVGLLALVGGCAGLVVAVWIERLLGAFVLPAGVALSSLRPWLDIRAISFALATVIIAAATIGAAPIVSAGARSLSLDARIGAGGSPRFGKARLLLGIQVAVCVILVFLAALFARSTSNALGADLGFDRKNLMSVSIALPPGRVFDTVLSSALADRVRRVPGVTGATIGPLPISRGSDIRRPEVTIDDQLIEPSDSIETVYGDADYFATLDLPVVAGRGFDERDGVGAPLVALVNESAARRFWPDGTAIGRRIGLPPPAMMRARGDTLPDFEVVGIVKDVKVRSIWEADQPVLYMPRRQHEPYLAGIASAGGASLIVRTDGRPEGLGNALATAATESGVTLRGVTSLDESLDGLLMPQRLGRALLSLLGTVAFLLTAVGVYGLVSCVVARGQKELGIRRALGASGQHIVATVLAQTLAPVTVGLLIGAIVVWYGGQFVERFTYGMGGSDPATLVATFGFILATGLVAALLPARRALAVDPVETLRAD